MTTECKASSSEEPGAGIPHAGICAGGARQRASLPRYITEYTDANGVVVAHYDYSPFGETLNQYGNMSDAFVFRFPTKYRNDDSRLYDYGYRFLSPVLGRWLNRDPLGESGGENLYSFLNNSPLNAIDPWGLKSSEETEEVQGKCCCGKATMDPAKSCCINKEIKGAHKCYIKIYVGHLAESMKGRTCRNDRDDTVLRVGAVCCLQKYATEMYIHSLLSYENDQRQNCPIFPWARDDEKIDLTDWDGPEDKFPPYGHERNDNIDNPVDVTSVAEAYTAELEAAKKEASTLCSIGAASRSDSGSESNSGVQSKDKKQGCCSSVEITAQASDPDGQRWMIKKFNLNNDGSFPQTVHGPITCVEKGDKKDYACKKRGGEFTPTPSNKKE